MEKIEYNGKTLIAFTEDEYEEIKQKIISQRILIREIQEMIRND